jgi:hypothetical protein
MASYSPWGKGGAGAPHTVTADGNNRGRGGNMRKSVIIYI